MTKIILDTNVIVSALIKSDTPPALILSSYVPFCELCLSEIIFSEYETVLARPKFRSFPTFYDRAKQVLTLLQQIGTFYTPDQKINYITDEADNRFLELAIIAQADYLITGNTNDFNFTVFENTKIVTPSEFINSFSL